MSSNRNCLIEIEPHESCETLWTPWTELNDSDFFDDFESWEIQEFCVLSLRIIKMKNTWESLGFKVSHKVIREKSHGEGSLIVQDTIENVSEPKFFLKLFKKKIIFFSFILCQKCFHRLKCFLKIFFAHENMKKLSSKVAHNRPRFFFSTANPHKTSPNLNFCSLKISHGASYV